MLRVGLVGLGGMGTVHYNNYLHMEEARVVAAVGKTDQDAQRAKAYGVPLYEQIPDMLAQESIDLLDVCTPTFLHKEQVMAGLSQKKHVITEKPIALTLRDAQDMYAIAQEQGVQLYVAQVLQFAPEVELLHQLVKNHAYGRPLDGCFERLSACPQWNQGSWLLNRTLSGGIPFDLHIHDLDLIVSLFGNPKGLRYTSCGGKDKAYQEQYRFTYDFEDLHVSAEAAWFNAPIPFTARWRVYFENGILMYDGQTIMGYRMGEEPHVYEVQDKVRIPTGINLPPTGSFLRELTHFVDCAIHNRPSDKVPKEQVLAVISLLEGIRE